MNLSLQNFQPINELQENESNNFISLGLDPHFIHVCKDKKPYPAGTYTIECNIQSDSIDLNPCIYIDTGAGFSETNKIILQHSKTHQIRVLIELPQAFRALRFDPCENPGEFVLRKLKITKKNKISSLIFLLDPYIKNLKKNPMLFFRYAKKLSDLFFSGKNINQHIKEIGSIKSSYHDWLKKTEKSYGIKNGTATLDNLSYKPKISIIMPTYNANVSFFHEAIESIINQSYLNWQLCIADDASTNKEFAEKLRSVATSDARISVVWRQSNGHISAASNSALKICEGDYICLVDHDDVVHSEALAEFVLSINKNSEIDVWYSDEDKLTASEELDAPTLKPDWAPHLLFSQQYIGHLVCIRRSCLTKIGGFNEDVNGAQDYDLLLRLAGEGFKFGHIPKVLYHWREHVNSTANNPNSKPYAHVAGELAVSRAIEKRYGDLVLGAESDEYLFTYKPIFNTDKINAVSIIIPTRDRVDLLKVCIDSIFMKTVAVNYEIVIVDNGSVEAETFEYFQSLIRHNTQVNVVRADIEFNWSKLNNIGVKNAKHDIFLFLNNDIEVIEPKWLYWLSGYANLPDVGSVGALLLYPDNTIQHAGVVLGMSGWADHVYKACQPLHNGSPFTSPMIARNVLANTGACMAIARNKFLQIGGFDEDFIVCGSDVEICLRLEAHAFKNVYCPYAKLFHYESKSRDPSKVPENDFYQSSIKYEPYRTKECDPYFNENLDMYSPQPKIKSL
jgi:GT2 family glycosyltransferase